MGLSGLGPRSTLAGPVCLGLRGEAFSDLSPLPGMARLLLCVWWVCVSLLVSLCGHPLGTRSELGLGLFPTCHSEVGEVLPLPQSESRMADVGTYLLGKRRPGHQKSV